MSSDSKKHDLASKNGFLYELPISSFAMVMGLSGLSLVWGKLANMGWLAGVAQPVALALALIAGLTFAVLLALYF
jgi:tellurite resistance protein TehA-like permease